MRRFLLLPSAVVLLGCHGAVASRDAAGTGQGGGGAQACAGDHFAPHIEYVATPQPFAENGLAQPRTVAAADLNGDGAVDLVVAIPGNVCAPMFCCIPSSSNVGVLLNKGDGTFAPVVEYGAELGSWTVLAVDLNGDGKPDLAVSYGGSDVPSPPVGPGVSVLLNYGDGTFAAPVAYPVGMVGGSIAAADLNGDGKPDLAVVGGYGTVDVLLNHGDGTFGAPVQYFTSSTAGAGSGAIVLADLDGDGKIDLAATNVGHDTVGVLLNHGDGTFAAPVEYPVSPDPSAIAAADLNGDGKIDLATANASPQACGQAAGPGSVSVLINHGDGTFAARVDYPTVDDLYAIAAADLNGDGKPDLALASFYGGGLLVMLNNGDGTFASQVDYPTAYGPLWVVAADLNGDGRLDLAAADGDSVSVLLNVCPP